MNRNLDGCYFRVCRDGEWQSICFSDLTAGEREIISKDRPASWWESLARHLYECICEIADFVELPEDEREGIPKPDEGEQTAKRWQYLAIFYAGFLRGLGERFGVVSG